MRNKKATNPQALRDDLSNIKEDIKDVYFAMQYEDDNTAESIRILKGLREVEAELEAKLKGELA